jgi:hypothetical protein
MSLSSYFTEKCAKLIKENATLIQHKFDDGTFLPSVTATGSLVDAAQGGMGALADFSKDYVTANAGSLLALAASASGKKSAIENAFSLANNIMAAALMANNELVMFFIRNLAKSIMSDCDKKQKELEDMTGALVNLTNLLKVLTKGNPAYDTFIVKQRQALGYVVLAEKDLILVRDTFKNNSRWLSPVFKRARVELTQAQELILPAKNNPGIIAAVAAGDKVKAALSGNYKKYSAKTFTNAATESLKGAQSVLGTLLEDTPFPTTAEQMQAMLAIPKASEKVIRSAGGYLQANSSLNAKLAAFKLAYASIQEGLPDYFKNYILSLLDPVINQTHQLSASMAQTLNGSPTAYSGPIMVPYSNSANPLRVLSLTPEEKRTVLYKPKTAVVTVMGFKWAMDINLIFQALRTVPEGTLDQIAVSQRSADAYKLAVEQLKKMDTYTSSDVKILRTDAEEDVGDLETQLILFVLEANNAIVSNSMRPGALAVGKAMLKRLSITSGQLGEIKSVMDAFVKTPFVEEDLVSKVGAGLLKMFKDVGLDNAAKALADGDFKKFFKMSSKESTIAGAALITIALLKKCFDGDAKTHDNLQKVYFEVAKAHDLLNIKFTLDIDLAILKNLSECARSTAMANSFTLDEYLCGLIPKDGVVGDAIKKIADTLSLF